MKTSKNKVLLTCDHHLRYLEDIKNNFVNLDLIAPKINKQTLNADEMRELLSEVEYAIIGDDIVDHSTLENNKNLKHLIKWGVGIDSVNMNAVKENDICFYHTPGVFSDEVADLALGFLLSIERGIHTTNKKVVNGLWEQFIGNSLRQKKAFIIGLGSIGSEICKRLESFGVNVSGYDPYVETQIEYKTIDHGCKESDYIFLACNLTNENKHVINKNLIKKMKRGVVLVNISRGGLVCEKSIIEGIEDGIIKAVGLDVFENEPAKGSLLEHSPSVFGAHGGSSTIEAIKKINHATLTLVERLIANQPYSDLPVKKLN